MPTGIELTDQPHKSSLAAAMAHGLAVGAGARAVILVEGVSDQRAVQALAARRGLDLHAQQVSVVPMGGATNIGHFVHQLGPDGLGVRLAGLCDAGEEAEFQRGLRQAGLGSDLTRAEMERRGFFVCVEDLEDELIRSLGVAAVEQLIQAQGELGSFRTMQRQPAQRGRTITQQLRRFMGTRSGRKIRYAPLLVDALDLKLCPPALDGLLVHVSRPDLHRSAPSSS
ncbi:MAG TPA: ATP-dependent endonuclease [Euzebya sp.]|nr:ATP-dependent endonuclease [Euzebya sp.]